MKQFVDRLLSETPKFWLRVQIVCLILSVAIGHLMNLPAMAPYHTALVFLCGGFAFLAAAAQLAVKDMPLVGELIQSPGTIIDRAPEILDALAQLKLSVTDPKPYTIADVTEKIGELSEVGSPKSEVGNSVTVVEDLTPYPTNKPVVNNAVV
jgi:hypothetical protein